MTMELTTLAYGLVLGAAAAVLLWALPSAYLAANRVVRARLNRPRRPRPPRTRPPAPMTRARSFGL